MGAEEVVCGFKVHLAADAKNGEDLLTIEETEGVRVEVYDGWGARVDHGVDCVADFTW